MGIRLHVIAEEQVPNRNDFLTQFESALAGEADSNKDGYITDTKLGIFLQDSVINYIDFQKLSFQFLNLTW